MKPYSFIAILLLAYSCKNGAADAEEKYIRMKISLHNNSGLHYILDSINKREELKASVLFWGETEPRAEQFSDSIIKMVYKDNNVPYSLSLDYHLTYEKFIFFCQENQMDPVQAARMLNKE